MTTSTWASVVAQTNDADFRTWGSELAPKLAAAGLVQTADTGQINWSTVTRGAINTAAGYEIWRFNDSLASSNPVYLKIEYGSGSTQAIPNMWLTVGQGSNGSGTLTGQLSTRKLAAQSAVALTSTVTNYTSYLCVTEGYVGLLWKASAKSAAATPGAFFTVGRWCDSGGTPNGNGVTIYASEQQNNTQQQQSVRFTATAATFTLHTSYCVVPGAVSASTVGSDYQVYTHWMIEPQVKPVWFLCSVIAAEVALGSSFSVALVGASARTFLGINQVGQRFEATNNAAYNAAMLWE
jgi:hypothetical protein